MPAECRANCRCESIEKIEKKKWLLSDVEVEV